MFTETTRKISVPGGEVTVIACIPEDAEKRARTPLIVVHGGPGGNHDVHKHYYGSTAHDRPVYFYDQLGSAASPAPFSENLTVLDRFIEELHAILDSQGIEKAIVLGHSFGGAIAADFALAHPERTAAVIFSSPLLSTPRWIADQQRLLAAMPPEIQDTIRNHLEAGTTGDPAYQAAEKEIYKRHYCRLEPWPEIVEASNKKTNVEVYVAMWGVSEFVCTGTLKDYDRFSDLHRLSMPVLLTCGRHDEATPETMAEASALIPDSRLHVFEHSGHLPMAEETENYCRVITSFMSSLPRKQPVQRLAAFCL